MHDKNKQIKIFENMNMINKSFIVIYVYYIDKWRLQAKVT